MQITGLPVRTGKGKEKPHHRGGGLLFALTESTTINFQNTGTAAQAHLVLSYHSSIFFQCTSLCLDFLLLSPCYALSFELQTIDDIFPVAIGIRWVIVTYIMASPRGAHN